MPIYSGIDEAGLGPILGPYCATGTTFSSPSPLKDLLQDQQKKLFTVDDSKKVYQGKRGFERLEHSVLSFYTLLTGKVPDSFKEFIPSLKSPWYSNDLKLPLKVSKDKIVETAGEIAKLFNKRGIELIDIKRTAVSAEDFNKLLDKFDNKSIVCQKIIEPLIKSKAYHPGNNIVIDKQGGRKFYKDYLEMILHSDSIVIMSEENSHSHYSTKGLNIHFKAKADSTSFSVALSSMFSKYMRELAMHSFNKHWSDKNPGIRSTAGYYTDGIRFINDLKTNNIMPADPDILIRKK